MSQMLMVFSKFELKIEWKILQNLKLLSGVAILASKCDCSIASQMWRFLFHFNFFEELV